MGQEASVQQDAPVQMRALLNLEEWLDSSEDSIVDQHVDPIKLVDGFRYSPIKS